MLFPDIPVMDNYLIYIALAFLFVAFLIINIRPKKKKEEVYKATFTFEDESFKKAKEEIVNEEYEKIQENKECTCVDEKDACSDCPEDEPVVEEPKLVQLSIFHKNYQQEIAEIVPVEDLLEHSEPEIQPIETLDEEQPRLPIEDIESLDDLYTGPPFTPEEVKLVLETTDIPDEEEKDEIAKSIDDFFTNRPKYNVKDFTSKELKSIARENGISGYGKMKKVELVEALNQLEE